MEGSSILKLWTCKHFSSHTINQLLISPDIRMTRRYILTQNTAVNAMAQLLRQLRRSLGAAIPVTRFEKHMPASHGRLGEGRMWSNVNVNTMQNG